MQVVSGAYVIFSCKASSPGNTPLHLSVMLGRKEFTKLLLAHNAPVKVKNIQGWSPLSEAISYGDRQTSK